MTSSILSSSPRNLDMSTPCCFMVDKTSMTASTAFLCSSLCTPLSMKPSLGDMPSSNVRPASTDGKSSGSGFCPNTGSKVSFTSSAALAFLAFTLFAISCKVFCSFLMLDTASLTFPLPAIAPPTIPIVPPNAPDIAMSTASYSSRRFA